MTLSPDLLDAIRTAAPPVAVVGVACAVAWAIQAIYDAGRRDGRQEAAAALRELKPGTPVKLRIITRAKP